MDVVHTVQQARRRLADLPRPIGFVPTMGALHDGHRALVAASRARDAATVGSVYVNPLQFGPGEDFDAYPRDLDSDLAVLEADGVALTFTPGPSFTPSERRTEVVVTGPAGPLEGRARPGHFTGVATVVTQLLGVVGPDRAYFGEKDYQQLQVVRALVEDLCLPVEIVACPTVREADGLARSSRNAYLDAAQRLLARHVPAALAAAVAGWDGDADAARDRMAAELDRPGITVDYVEVADPVTLARGEGRVAGPARALVAARIGGTRLIDNVALAASEPTLRPRRTE